MRASTLPILGGLVAFAQASPHLLGGLGGLGGLTNKISGIAPATCSLAQDLEDHTLFAGYVLTQTAIIRNSY